MAREELNEAEVRCNEVVDVLLVFGQSVFVSRSEFLLAVEWIGVPGKGQ